MSEYEQVREFNQAAEQECPEVARSMTRKEVEFLTQMMLDELMELMITVNPEYKKTMIKMIEESRDLEYKELNEIELIAEQGDALVDSNYYALNAAAKCGIRLDRIFEEVHYANMSKRDTTTGKFIKDERGKILKPKNWKAPDIIGLVKSSFVISNSYTDKKE